MTIRGHESKHVRTAMDVRETAAALPDSQQHRLAHHHGPVFRQDAPPVYDSAIPITRAPGLTMEVDFGESWAVVGGELHMLETESHSDSVPLAPVRDRLPGPPHARSAPRVRFVKKRFYACATE